MAAPKETLLLSIPSAALSHLHSGSKTESACTFNTGNSLQSRLQTGQLKAYLTDTPTPADPGLQIITLSINNLEIPLEHNSRVVFKQGAYIFPPPSDLTDLDRSDGDGLLQLEIPQASRSDRELLRSIITDWTSLQHHQGQDLRSQLVLIDEHTGDVVGQLTTDFTEDASLKQEKSTAQAPHEYVFDDDKEPVVVSIDTPTDAAGNGYPSVRVSPLSNVSAKYGKSPSKIVSSAEFLSRGILTAADKIGGSMTNVASSYTAKTQPTQSPLVFHSTAKKGVEGLHGLTETAVMISGKTIGAIGAAVGNVGSKLGNKLGINKVTGNGQNGAPPSGIKGVISSSIQAFTTLAESVEASGKHIYDSSTAATAHVAYHKLGPDAAHAVNQISSSGRNVALVYIDARGFGRRAMVKNFGKGAIKARMSDGSEVTLAPDAAIINEKGDGATLNDGAPMQIIPPTTPVQGYSTGVEQSESGAVRRASLPANTATPLTNTAGNANTYNTGIGYAGGLQGY